MSKDVGFEASDSPERDSPRDRSAVQTAMTAPSALIVLHRALHLEDVMYMGV
jgi:hypothetical protein